MCDEIKEDSEEIIPANGHSFGEWQLITPPEGSGKEYEQRVCEVCGYIETRNGDIEEHEWEEEYTIDKEPTCTEEGSKSIHCKDCDAVKDGSVVSISALGHLWDDGDVIKSVTCTEDGEKQYTCQNCGETRTETVTAAGHQWKEEYTVDKEASCKEEGSESIHCSVCGTIDEDTVRAIKKTDHNPFASSSFTIALPGSSSYNVRSSFRMAPAFFKSG